MKRVLIKSHLVLAAIITIMCLLSPLALSTTTFATGIESRAFSGFLMSPMTSKFALDPGETHTDSFYLVNPEENIVPVDYELAVQSFYRDENSDAIFEDVEGRGQLAQWTTLNVPTSGTIKPGEFIEIIYTVNVPKTAPFGGQYAAITATSAVNTNENAVIHESVVMAHTIFAEINGNTVRSSKLASREIPTFLFDGPIKATSTIVNTGNVHGVATFDFQVSSFFTGEVLYSNSSDPDKRLILPDRSYTNESTWSDTPIVGIFKVSYAIDFEGDTSDITAVVVKCPIWLMLILLLVPIAIIILIVFTIKHRHSKLNSESQD